jgi:hypothetical protein
MRKAKQSESGVIYFSKILEILYKDPMNFNSYLNFLRYFCDDVETRKKWEQGIRIDKDNKVSLITSLIIL